MGKLAIFEREEQKLQLLLSGTTTKPIESYTQVRQIKAMAEFLRGSGRLKPEPFFVPLEPGYAEFAHTDLNDIDRYYLNLASPILTTPVQRLLNRGKTVPLTWRPPRVTPKEPLKFIRIRASKEDTVNLANATQFLLAITDRVSFEVIGNSRDITVQLACDASYFQRLVGILQTHYKISEFVETDEDALDQLDGSDWYLSECAMASSHVIPLETHSVGGTEPMQVLVGVLDEMDEGNVGALQIVLTPCRNNWMQNLRRCVVDDLTNASVHEEPNLVPLANQKIRSPLYAVAFRVAATHPELLTRFESYTTQFAGEYNRLIALNPSSVEDDIIIDGFFARMAWRPGMILNAEELVSFAHLPPESVFSDKLGRVRIEKIRAPLEYIEGDGLLIGENPYHNHPYQVRIPPGLLNKHMLVAGSTRMGKSTLMGNMIRSLIGQHKGIFLIDPKGSLAKEVARSIPEELIRRAIYFNPSDQDHPIAMNLMRFAKRYDPHELINDMVSILDKVTVTLMPATPKMWELFAGAMRFFLRLAKTDPTVTLRDVRNFFHDTDYRKRIIDQMTEPVERAYWVAYQRERERSYQPDTAAMGLTARLAQLVDDPAIANTFCAQECVIDFAEVFNEERIFIADLGDVGEWRKNFIGRILVAEAQLSCMARKAHERTDVFFFMDEFQDYQTMAFEDVLARGAEYRMNMVLAHQNYAQVEHKTMQSVLGNAGTILAFRVGEDYAARLARSFASTWRPEAFLNLPAYECLVRTENKQFSLRSYSPDEYGGIEELAEISDSFDAVVAYTRENYAVRPVPPPPPEEQDDESDHFGWTAGIYRFELRVVPLAEPTETPTSSDENADAEANTLREVSEVVSVVLRSVPLPEDDAPESDAEQMPMDTHFCQQTVQFGEQTALVAEQESPQYGEQTVQFGEQTAQKTEQTESSEPVAEACPFCGLPLPTHPPARARHLRACETESEARHALEETGVRCPICDEPQRSERALNAHLGRTHSPEEREQARQARSQGRSTEL